jgi:ABC-type branched-subunit amino acid transport system ATPase component
MLEIEDVRLSFGGVKALAGATFAVARNRLTGLIGPNGAGKTTLFNVVSGLLRPNDGAIRFDGADIAGLSPDRISGLGLVRTFQIARGFPRLTVFDHLMLYGKSQPGETLAGALLATPAARRREAELAERALATARRLKLERLLDNRVDELSGGQKKLLEIGRALMAEPKMILLDEPAAGVNPTLAEAIGDHLLALVAEGYCVLIVEHDMALIERVCGHVVVMAEGRFLTEGSFADIREDRRVQDAYLGGRR